MTMSLQHWCRSAGLTFALVLAGLQPAPAEAADCWVATRAPARTGTGEALSHQRFAGLVAAMDRAEALLRSDPVLNALPGVRLQISRHLTFIDNERPTYTASVLLALHEPAVWGRQGCSLDQGQADYRNTRGIEIAFNQIEDVLNEASATEEGHIANLDLETLGRFRATGTIRSVGQGLKGFRSDGGPILVPLTVEAHLAIWETRLAAISAEGGGAFAEPQLAELRRHRAALSPAERAAQVAIAANPDETLWSYARAGEPASLPVHAVAAELLGSAADKAAIRLVTLKWYGPDGDDALTRQLEDWVAGFTASRARQLIKGESQ
jgi:hypothetical protein